MGRFQINVRTDQQTSDLFNSQVEQSKLTKIGYIKKLLKDASQGKTLELLYERLKTSQQENEDLHIIIERYEKKEGKKMEPTRQITFKVSYDLFETLTDLAHERKIYRNQLLTVLYSKQNNNLMLPIIT